MFYDLKATSLQGKPINFSDLKDKVVLIVNTASECGFTYQYEGLQKLHEEYADKGLVIIGFPCNQFGNQEPGDASTIQQGCLINYGVDFLISEKVDVNGKDAHPVYQYLKSKKTGFFGKNIKWNFTKFLINRHGEVENRFAPVTKPQAIAKKIEKLL
ncbi:glutathione peroxidase [Pseudoalteromonas phenolica]|jgi:glutathione peroxidase|uniref:Glutathione peroxidase n=1 Tax=Pseudoalteromonas phenolica TaxID=161398 RepID=A0A4V2EJB8_9GAMM|nr:glutathione peroxidase [Pseudoalteromonas phenolica]RZQ51798.1 glutathione peroxidase [Pseudoalteromonas phenolica]TMN90088.1 glutathione peroxidase [Pseudoalteromonas phenolica]